MNNNVIRKGGLRKSGFLRFNKESEPVVSIVTVVLNDPKGLQSTIESVINQNYSNFEYIIIDGGSDDGTLSVIRQFDDQIDYWLSKKDRGIYDAMNKGIKISSGEIIGSLNAGDCYCKDTVAIVIDAFKSADRPKIVFGDVIMCDQNKDQLYTASVRKRILKDGWMPHPAVFVKRQVYEEFGCFDVKFRVSADYDFMLRTYSRTKRTYIERPLAKMQTGGISTKRVFMKAKEDHIARKSNGISFPKNLLFTILAVVSPVFNSVLSIVFQRSGFRFENTKALSWMFNNQKVS